MNRTFVTAVMSLCLCAGSALAQEKKPEAKPAQPAAQPAAKPAAQPAAKPATPPAAKPAEKAPAGQPSEEEMMKQWMAANAPGENHKVLMHGVGTWSAKVKTWMMPGGPASESDATAVVSEAMGGRFTKTEFSGMMGPAPFTGTGYYGYNNATKKFESFWIDSMSTGMMNMTGTYNAAKKEMNWSGKMVDPMDGKEKAIRIVEKYTDDNSMTFEMFGPDDAGKEFKNLEITYARTGGVKPAAAPKGAPAAPAAPAKK